MTWKTLAADAHDRLTVIESRLTQISRVDYELAFILALVVFVSLIILDTFRYRPTSQYVPLVIGAPTLMIFLAILVMNLGSVFRDEDDELAPELEEQPAEEQELPDMQFDTRGDLSLEAFREKSLRAMVWVGIFLAFIVLGGFIPGLFICVFFFNWYFTKMKVTHNVVYTAGFFLFIWFIFHEFLNVRFPSGLLF